MTLVALTGPAGSGKSTAADYLVKHHGFVKVKLAGPLKAMMRAIGFTEEEIEGDKKQTPMPILGGKTPRHAMQTLGTEWGRFCIGDDFWINLWEQSACAVLDEGGKVVVDDCRFPNEAERIRRLGGRIIRLSGRGGIAGGHTSEAQRIGADTTVYNLGSIDELCRAVGVCIEEYEFRAA